MREQTPVLAGPQWVTFTVPLAQIKEPGLTQTGRGAKAHHTGPGMANEQEGRQAAC